MKSKSHLKLRQIEQDHAGLLQGGFVLLNASEQSLVLGGEESNNCKGSNCVSGCGTNLEAGCGSNVNTVAGCGTKAVNFA